jgi:hypothetical protein
MDAATEYPKTQSHRCWKCKETGEFEVTEWKAAKNATTKIAVREWVRSRHVTNRNRLRRKRSHLWSSNNPRSSRLSLFNRNHICVQKGRLFLVLCTRKERERSWPKLRPAQAHGTGQEIAVFSFGPLPSRSFVFPPSFGDLQSSCLSFQSTNQNS